MASVNVISAVALAGIAVAAAAMVCVLSVFNGFEDVARSRLSLFDPPTLIIPQNGKTIDNADIVGSQAAAPMIVEQGLAVAGDKQLAVTLIGVDQRWAEITGFSQAIIDGSHFTSDNPDAYGPATISVGAAMNLGARPAWATPIEIYLPKRLGRINPANPMAAFRSDTLLTSAVYQINQPELDAPTIIMPIERLRALLDYTPGQASRIALPAMPANVPDGLIAQDPLQQHAASFSMIHIEKWISFLMLVFILVIASFNIISTLAMLIIEKKQSVFTLRAMGATPRQVSAVFVIEGWLITLLGGLIGIFLGSVLTLAQQHWGIISLGGNHAQMSITAYPARLAIWPDLPAILAVVALTGLLTGLATLLATRQSAARQITLPQPSA